MNTDTLNDFHEALKLVDGDRAAAASLTLAAALRESRVNAPLDKPLTVPEAARLLRVSRDKVLSWIRSGRLRAYNIAERENGRPKYRINRDDLDGFVQQRTVMRPARKGRPAGRRSLPAAAEWPTL